MIFKNSLKQFLRTPGKLILFILLFAVAAFFLCTGTMLWARNRSIVSQYESTFLTVGTVEQVPDSTRIDQRYDAFTQTYDNKAVNVYSQTVPNAVMDFDGANYILPAVQRPFYGAYMPELQMYPYAEGITIRNTAVIEFTALEDSTAEQMTPVKVTRVLHNSAETVKNNDLDQIAYKSMSITYLPQVGDVIPICDHRNDSPQPLRAGETYIACVEGGIHDIALLGASLEYQQLFEWRLQEVDFCTLYTRSGEPVEDGFDPVKVQPVTAGFYETEAGKCWLAYADTLSLQYDTLPVIPTNATELLLPFYQRSLCVIDGEDISPQEYADGEKVCLVSENFAALNGLRVGDTLRLPLYFADYCNDPTDIFLEWDLDLGGASGGMIWSWGLGGTALDAQGAPLAVFSDHTYTIKGIYNSVLSRNAALALGANAVVIPAASVQESDEHNIIAHGRMQDSNTSFQIPNGSITSYMEAWSALGHENVKLTFYDRGYSQMQRGIENMKRTSTLFLALGGAMTVALLLFFCNLFITKNKPRTAVERMLGYTKKQCTTSLLAGFLLAALLATVLGSGVGLAVEQRLSSASMHADYYDNSYTLGKADTVEIDFSEHTGGLACLMTAAVLLVLTGIVSKLFMASNLKEEPLLMLGQKQE